MRDTIRARAPLRLGLAGGGTDVSPYSEDYGGAVLNATIDRYAMASITPRQDGRVVFHAVDLDQVDEFDLDGPIPLDAGLRLHRGVYNRLIEEFNGGRRLAITMSTHVDSPMGSGLGSSSALVVAMVEALREVVGAPLGEYEVARLAFDIERRDLALGGGKQDQYAAAFGGFNFIEFSAQDRVIVNPLRIKPWILNELETSLVLFYTGASRESAKIIRDQSENIGLGGEAMEGMHRLKASAIRMKEAVLFGDIAAVAALLREGWEAKKQTSSAVTNPEMDALYEEALRHGAMAGKLSGAGGGGFFMFLADPIRRPELIRRLSRHPSGRVEVFRFTGEGVSTWRGLTGMRSPPHAVSEV
jgi:D-glycero-alpha-D-manno-heptose-7-phosphate kinase